MTAISIFDLTDAQVDQIVAARRANPEPPRPGDAFWRGVIARRRRAERVAQDQAIGAVRRCGRCGIDTVAPDLCQDCVEVLAS